MPESLKTLATLPIKLGQTTAPRIQRKLTSIDIQVPVTAVVGIYSQENGQGVVFEHEASDDLPPTPPSGPKAVKKSSTKPSASLSDKAPKKIKPSLRVIK